MIRERKSGDPKIIKILGIKEEISKIDENWI